MLSLVLTHLGYEQGQKLAEAGKEQKITELCKSMIKSSFLWDLLAMPSAIVALHAGLEMMRAVES